MHDVFFLWWNLPIHYDWQGHNDCSKYLLLYMLQQTCVTLRSLFILIFFLDIHPQTRGTASIQERAAIANVYCIKKKEKREGRLTFLFSSQSSYSLFKRLSLIHDRGMPIDRENKISRWKMPIYFLFSFLYLSIIFIIYFYNENITRWNLNVSTSISIISMPDLSKHSNWVKREEHCVNSFYPLMALIVSYSSLFLYGLLLKECINLYL